MIQFCISYWLFLCWLYETCGLQLTTTPSQQTPSTPVAQSTPESTASSVPSTPTSTSMGTPLFSRTEDLIEYLKSHPKTRDIDFGKSIISIEERKKVVAVATTKLVEVHTAYPSTESKLQLARMLSDVSGLPQEVLFDRVSHKGYINRYLDNLRCKMSPSKRRYTWKKKLQVDQSVVVTPGTSSLASNGVLTVNNGQSTQGCPRGISDCILCRGTFQHNYLLKLIALTILHLPNS